MNKRMFECFTGFVLPLRKLQVDPQDQCSMSDLPPALDWLE